METRPLNASGAPLALLLRALLRSSLSPPLLPVTSFLSMHACMQVLGKLIRALAAVDAKGATEMAAQLPAITPAQVSLSRLASGASCDCKKKPSMHAVARSPTRPPALPSALSFLLPPDQGVRPGGLGAAPVTGGRRRHRSSRRQEGEEQEAGGRRDGCGPAAAKGGRRVAPRRLLCWEDKGGRGSGMHLARHFHFAHSSVLAPSLPRKHARCYRRRRSRNRTAKPGTPRATTRSFQAGACRRPTPSGGCPSGSGRISRRGRRPRRSASRRWSRGAR